MRFFHLVSFSFLLVLTACKENEYNEIEVRIDEEKLGRAIGKQLIAETHRSIAKEPIPMHPKLDMTLPQSSEEPPSSSQSLTPITITLEIKENGSLYGIKAKDTVLLADKVSHETLDQAKKWLEKLQRDHLILDVSVTIADNQSQQSAIDLINLLREMGITKLKFSDLIR